MKVNSLEAHPGNGPNKPPCWLDLLAAASEKTDTGIGITLTDPTTQTEINVTRRKEGLIVTGPDGRPLEGYDEQQLLEIYRNDPRSFGL